MKRIHKQMVDETNDRMKERDTIEKKSAILFRFLNRYITNTGLLLCFFSSFFFVYMLEQFSNGQIVCLNFEEYNNKNETTNPAEKE